MPRLQSRTFASSDDIRRFPNGHASVLQLDETVVGYGVYEPGWRWTTDMPAIAGTPTCQLHHMGYAISGAIHVLTEAGQDLEIGAGSVYDIPPGHDAWVVGDEPFVTLDWTSARTFGLAPEGFGEGVIVTILFTDIVDSTTTLHRIGDQAWRAARDPQRAPARTSECLRQSRGQDHRRRHPGRVRSAGSGRSLRPGDECDLACNGSAHSGRRPHGRGRTRRRRCRGLAVHTAARVMALGSADDVMVSSTTRELLEGSGIGLEDAGEHALKGLPGLRRVFRLAR